MTAGRAVALCVLFGAIGLAIVTLRGAQVAAASRIQALNVESIRLRREVWDIETHVARVRSPNQIRERVGRMDLTVSVWAPVDAPPNAMAAATAEP